MDNLVNNVITGINAVIYYITAAISVAVKNPVILIGSAFMILMSWPGHKTFEAGKLKAKG